MVVDGVEEGEDGRPVGENGDVNGCNRPTRRTSEPNAMVCRSVISGYEPLMTDMTCR